ncbi:LamG-like jellyroll fold domain-containing protein [Streptomyces aidingensis]|uniref:RHS repeat-associated core domain-containing protein n=1 Tax=Streptomyces aidingensis TaxID=910347 RepID=A0A1I1MGA6_9ACTN|nr:LamG-like jellyroll fold domain-containing protein [Streptomyces aidingensis]SFC83822.1 RHS repeat-associated core domain-containing protein [Streptomyces aidingensis]
MAVLTGTETAAAAAAQWQRDRSPAAADPGRRPEQSWDAADGRGHRAPSADTTATTGKGRAPGTAPGELPAEEDLSGPQDLGDTRPPLDPASAEFLGTRGVGEPPGNSFDEQASVEVADKRDERSRTYLNQDGTFTTRYFNEPVNFRNSDGDWQEIDPTLRREIPTGLSTQSVDGWSTTSTEVGISFGPHAAADPLATLRLDAQHAVGFSLTGAQPSPGSAEGALIRYPDVLGTADLEFIAGSETIKETLVLDDPAAPTEWHFPLHLEGLTAALDDSGGIAFTDAAGVRRAWMPPGWMQDADLGEHSGEGAISDGVAYTLSGENGGQVLTVTLDAEWLADPERVYPVRVDPTITSVTAITTSSATYVQKPYNTNFNDDTVLKVGTHDGGTSTAAAFMRFSGVNSTLNNAWVLGARLSLYNNWSYSCNSRPVTVHTITQNWDPTTLANYPGPSTGAALTSKSFAHGWRPAGTTSWTCAPAWESIPLGEAGRKLVDDWTHGRRNNYGLALKASTTDSLGWKQFGSDLYPNGKPSLDVTWTKYGATYAPGQLVTPVTATQDGTMKVTVRNQGTEMWPTGGDYQLTYHLYNSSGTELTSSALRRFTLMPENVSPGEAVTVDAAIAALQPGTYTLVWTMTDYGTARFTNVGIPGAAVKISTVNIPPALIAAAPGSGAAFETLTPTLWAKGSDPDHYPSATLQYTFEVCEADGANTRKNCRQGTRSTSPNWTVPDGWLAWNKTYAWYAYVWDGSATSLRPNPSLFSVKVPQPAVTGYLGGEMGHDFGARIGNYATSATDASIAAVGPELAVIRTYNSLDPRTDTAFGQGWTSRWDMRAEADAAGNVVVTLASGRRVRFGLNADGSYTPPPGSADTLTAVPATGGWVLRTTDTATHTFDADGHLTTLTDGAGREQLLTYTAGRLTRATDAVSGRHLDFTWDGPHVSSVTTSPAETGGTGLTWSYQYTDGRLTQVCPPDEPTACTRYQYQDGSLYRSAVLDESPVSYWPLGETGGELAHSVAPSRTGFNHAEYYNVEYGAPGALAGSDDTAVTFNGTDSSVRLPDDTLRTSTFLTIELWFRTTQPGVLIGFQNSPLEDGYPSQKNPPLTVDADGRLSGFFYTGQVDAIDPIKSTATVTDGQWHHAVLTAAGTSQTLYLDGLPQGSRTGPLGHRDQSYTYLGAGWSDSRWDGGPSEVRYFTGQMDDVAVHHRPLDAATVAEHYAARTARGLMTTVTLPSGRTHATNTYDTTTARITTHTDAGGGTWQISAPGYSGGSAAYTDFVRADSPTGYWRLDDPAGAVAASPLGDHLNGTYLDTLRRGAGPFAGGDTTAPLFDGDSAVQIPAEAWGTTGRQTVELWFRTDSHGVLIGMQDAPFGDDATAWWPMLLVDSDGMLRGRFRFPGDDTTLMSQTAVDDDEWHHALLTGDSSGQALFLDGRLQASNTHGTDTQRLPYAYIGGGVASPSWGGETGNGHFNFTGQIADVAVYDDTVWASGFGGEVEYDRDRIWTRHRLRRWLIAGTGENYEHAVRGSAPAAYWKLDERTGTLVADEIAGRDATLTGTYPTSLNTEGVFGPGNGTSLRLSNPGDHVDFPGTIVAGTDELSAELWFRTRETGGVLLAWQNAPAGETPSHWHPVLSVDGAGKLRGEWWVAGLGGADPITSPQAVNDYAWHHVVLAGAGTTQTLYLDGEQIGTFDGQISEPGLSHGLIGTGYASPDWIGLPGGTYSYEGVIDEVALYRHTLTEDQVRAHYLAQTQPETHSLGATVTVTDPAGNTTSTSYDVLRGWRTTAATDAEGGVTRYAYDTGGFQHTVTDPNGNSVITGHDKHGNVVSTSTCRGPGNCQTSFATHFHNESDPLDPRNGAVLTMSDARSQDPADETYRTTTTYTPLGLPATTTLADGRSSSRTYTDGTEAAADGGTVPAGLVKSITTTGGAVTSYDYYAGGDIARITAPSGAVTEYDYDGLGRQTSQTVVSDAHPDGLTTTYVYDSMSRIVRETAPGAVNEITGTTHTPEIRRTYDDDGNLLTETVADLTGGDPERTTSYLYNTLGQNEAVIDAEGNTTTYVHDDFGRVTRETDPLGTVYRYSYTPRGQLAETVLEDWTGDPAGGVRDLVLESRAYDPAGRLASVTDAMGATVSHTYFDDGLLATTTAHDVTQSDGTTRDIVLESNTYDPAGHLIRQTTGNGTTTVTHEYDATGRTAASVLDPDGLDRRTTFAYDNDDRVLETRQTGGGSTTPYLAASYTYDPAGNVLTETLSDAVSSSTTRHHYNQLGQVTATVSPRGTETGADPDAHTTDFRYDTHGRLVAATSPPVMVERDGDPAVAHRPEVLTGYNTFGDTTAVRDAEGNTTSHTLDLLGRPTETRLPDYTRPDGTTLTALTTTVYDRLGNVLSTTDPLGNVTEFAYDQLGHLTQRTDPHPDGPGLPSGTSPTPDPFTTNTTPDGRGLHTYTWTPTGLQLSATDPAGARTEATYDELGRRLTSTVVERYPTPQNLTTTYTWDDAGRQTRSVTPRGTWTEAAYNAAGEPLTVRDATGLLTANTYDAFGRVTETRNALDHRSVTHYNHLGLPVRVDDYGTAATVQRSIRAEYDAEGHQTADISPTGARTTAVFDAMGRVTEQTEPITSATSLVTTFGYDANGNRTRLTDPRGNTTHYTFNAWGLPESTIEPATDAHPALADRTWTTLYDAAARPVQDRLPGGVTRTRTYDALGRMIHETGTAAEAATRDRHFTYDLIGRMITEGATNALLAPNTYTYNDRGQLLTAEGPAGNVSYTYDAGGNMASRTDAQGTTSYTHTARDQLATATHSVNGTGVSFTYDAAGRLTTETSGSARRSYTYDDLGRLASDTITDPATATELSAIDYTYDIDNRLTAKTTRGTAGAGSNTYTYDDAGRLTSWTRDGTTTDYTWDAAGNRTSADGVTSTYDERNRLLTEGSTHYTHTPRGTLSTVTAPGEDPRTLTFDAFERKITDGSTTFTYDSLDRVTTHNGTPFLYDGGSNNLLSDGTTHYTRTPGGALLTSTDATSDATSWLITDQHTDVVAGIATDEPTPALTTSRAYDPFGETLAATGPAPSLGYQSGWTDPDSGDINMASRWYQPGTGTFSSRDTWLLPPTPSIAANRYTYANASPLLHTDPTGHWALAAVAAAAVAGAVAVGMAYYASQNPATLTLPKLEPIGYNWLKNRTKTKSGLVAVGTGAGAAAVSPWSPSLGAAQSAARAAAQAAAAAATAAWAAEQDFLWRSRWNRPPARNKPGSGPGSSSGPGGSAIPAGGGFARGTSGGRGAGPSGRGTAPIPFIPQNPREPAPTRPAPQRDWNPDSGRWQPGMPWSDEITEEEILKFFSSEAFTPERAGNQSQPSPAEGEPGGPGVNNREDPCSKPRESRYHYQPTESGRPTGATALYCPGDVKPKGAARDDNGEPYVAGFPTQGNVENRVTIYHRTHIIADKFYGEWRTENLFTGYSQMNQSGMARCEWKIRKQLEARNPVVYSGQLIYEDPGDLVPSGIRMQAYTKEGELFDVVVPNLPQKSKQCG